MKVEKLSRKPVEVEFDVSYLAPETPILSAEI
jgi:hypothetical protein